MKFTRLQWQRRGGSTATTSATRFRWVRICAPVAMLLVVLSAHAQQSVIPPVGGSGGGEFSAHCPPSQLLGGVELRVGDVVDAIRPLCLTPIVNVKTVKVPSSELNGGTMIPEHYENRVSYGVNGDATATTGWYGGTGGGIKSLLCPRDRAPIVSGIYVEAEGAKTIVVRRITLLCEPISPAGGGGRDDNRWFDPRFTKEYEASNSKCVNCPVIATFEAPKASYEVGETHGKRVCPVSQDNHVTQAVGIQGRSGVWVDALGLICEFPKLPQGPIKAAGRVKRDGPPVASWEICYLAEEASRRHSPAAPGLDAQCTAYQNRFIPDDKPIKAIGRVKVPTSPDATGRSICDVAAEARARISPAAPGLEAQCRASLAAIGAAIAEADPIVADARSAAYSAEPDVPLPPVPPPATPFGLPGGHRQEPTANPGVLFNQGFDIATGMFGDPALGSQGRTAIGPSALRIRDSLDINGARGFDASVKFHLSRNYNP